MDPVDLSLYASDPEPRHVVYAEHQPPYRPLPALVYEDGKILTEWALSAAERAAIARGENIRLWIWVDGQPLQPLALEVTSEQHG